MQELIAKEIEPPEKDQVSYEIHWTIPDWRRVRQDVSVVKNQKAVFETGLLPNSTQTIQTKWLVGFTDEPICTNRSRARVCWQLLAIKGSGESLLKLDAKIETILLCSRISAFTMRDEQSKEVSLGESIEEEAAFLNIGTGIRNEDDNYINAKGAIEYKLVLTFKSPNNSSSHNEFKRLKLEQFFTRSHEQLRKNQAALLNGDSNGDLKIVTRDGVELTAHQSILKAQCPVFAVLLNSEFSERKSGVVKVDDISGKTMKILLHYFYTGDLLDGWSDHDTIVEFTYAAGKYLMESVLELLDDLFGRGAQREVSNLELQLLNLTGKFSMKNAEGRLLQQVIGKVASIKSAEELFQLFGYESEEISRMAGMLAGEQIGESKILEIVDYAFRSNPDFRDDFADRGMILLAFVQRNGSLKALEEILLKRFARITSNFKSAEEFFAWFGDGK